LSFRETASRGAGVRRFASPAIRRFVIILSFGGPSPARPRIDAPPPFLPEDCRIMSERNLFWLLGIAAVSLLGFAVTFNAAPQNKDYDDINLVVDVLHQVRKNYVTELSKERERKLIEDMINGGLERLDPHSQYINPHEWRQFNDKSHGEFGGIGIEVGYDRQNRGLLTVISPMPGTPAYDAGLLPEDTIVKIDGKSAENMRLSEAVDLIKGEPGEKITLTVLHEGSKEPTDVSIIRAIIEIKTVLGDLRKKDNPKEWDFFLDAESKIGYVRLTGFGEKTTRELIGALKGLKEAGMRGLVLDLRNNPGGLLREAVAVSNLFLKDGDRIVSTKGRNRHDEVYDARAEEDLLRAVFRDPRDAELRNQARGVSLQPAERFPMAVLVNRYSASASEIVSAALQDNGRAVVLGERSFGKGSVQDMIDMEKKTSRLKLTTASYWRPNGKNIHRQPNAKDTDEWGVKPDEGYEIKLKDDEFRDYLIYRHDRDLPPSPKGAKSKDKPKDKDKASPDGKKKEPFTDRVLAKAVEYLKTKMQ
jgi:carboxyl-terminal processing protease